MGIGKLPCCLCSPICKMTKNSRKIKAQKKLAKLSKSKADLLANSCIEEENTSEFEAENVTKKELDCGIENDKDKACQRESKNFSEDSESVSQTRKLVSFGDEFVENGGGDTELEMDQGVMLIVGPEKFTTGLLQIFETLNNNPKVKLVTIPEFIVEDAAKWRNENMMTVLFVVDYADENSLKGIDETLSTLQRNYKMSMDYIDFILAKAKEPVKDDTNLPICGGEILNFTLKYNRPLINMLFEEGWDLDKELVDKLRIFLKRFQLPPYPKEH